ncbi:unnamed protein product [Onchocerca flexuosa]|uniref:SUN domain-containing protein n=1 Tax=Onchocerca flexuosa TaxID=387005 RepID=A0A183H8Z2_9BILA|nr:unnamed protein product [Onchocerca flexuosa]
MLLIFTLLNLLLVVNGNKKHARQRRHSSIPCGINDNKTQTQRSLSEVQRNHTDIIRLINDQNITAAIRKAKDEIDMLFNDTEIKIFRSINVSILKACRKMNLSNLFKYSIFDMFKYSDNWLIIRIQIVENDGLPSERVWNAINKISHYSKKLSYSSQISIVATEKLYNSTLTFQQIPYELSITDFGDTTITSICPVNKVTRCPLIKYRTYSGHCNNVNHPSWGASFKPMQRLLKPIYADSKFIFIMKLFIK